MRPIKMFGLAMLAALATMAFAAVSSASAKELLLGASVCSKEGSGAETHCPAGTKALLSKDNLLALGKSTFTSGFVSITCDTVMHGVIHNGDGLDANGNLVYPLGLIQLVLLTNCKSSVCTFEHAAMSASHEKPWDVLVLGSATLGNGVLHVKEPLGLFRVNCGIFGGKQTCIYTKKDALTDALGHTPELPEHALLAATIHANVTGLEREVGSSGLCSAEGSWEALLHTEPSDLTIHLLEVLHP